MLTKPLVNVIENNIFVVYFEEKDVPLQSTKARFLSHYREKKV